MCERHNDRASDGSVSLAGSTGGFGTCLVTLVVGVVGLLVGMAIDGRLDLGSMLGPGRDR